MRANPSASGLLAISRVGACDFDPPGRRRSGILCRESYLASAGMGIGAKSTSAKRLSERRQARPYDTACCRGYSTLARPLILRRNSCAREKRRMGSETNDHRDKYGPGAVREPIALKQQPKGRRAISGACGAVAAIGFAAAIMLPEVGWALSEQGPPPSSIELTWREKAWLAKHQNIRVGAETNYAPYEFKDADGRFTGIIADYLDIIKHKVGAQFQVSQLRDFGTVEEKLRKRELDVILALAP